MEGTWNGAAGSNKYQYNGKEWNDDFGLGLNDYGFRMYDGAVGRWWVIDPMAERRINVTPYAYVLNNPIRLIDLMGLSDTLPEVTVTAQRSNASEQWRSFIGQWDNETFQEFRKGPAADYLRHTSYTTTIAMTGITINHEYDLGEDYVPSEDDAMNILKDWWASENSVNGMNYSSLRAEAVSSTEEGVKVLAPVVMNTLSAYIAMKMPLLNTAGRLEAANGLQIRGFKQHGLDQLHGRGVSLNSVTDALRNPLKINPITRDAFGRPSQRFLGRKAEVAVNPSSGKIVSVNPMGVKKLTKLLKQLGQ